MAEEPPQRNAKRSPPLPKVAASDEYINSLGVERPLGVVPESFEF